MSHILLLEDDQSLINGLSFALEREGYELDIARSIKEINEIMNKEKYDLVILDISLPDGSGFDICKMIRRTSTVPIIFLTAMDEEINIVMGLDIGADDYITKPFKLGVLLSRINALLRRAKNYEHLENELESNGIKVSRLTATVLKNGQTLNLTTTEFRLLCLFMQNPNLILSKNQILSKLWDADENYVDENTLNVYIFRLRMKIEDDPGNPLMLQTIRRMGYKWNIVK